MSRAVACHPAGGFIQQGQLWRNGQLLSAARRQQAIGSASGPWINDQADRALFATGLLLANEQQRASLLPASSAQDHLQQLQAQYPGAQELKLPALTPELPERDDFSPWHAAQNAVLCFTSGSTGQPKSIAKSWVALSGAVQGMAAAAGWQAGQTHIVATVPPQHMFGLEMSVLSALVCGCRVHSGKPFFPLDIADALASLPRPRVLVSTPLHLRALLKSGVSLPPLDQIVSATAPLDTKLARALEQAMGARVLEVYGSTETGAIASRYTAQRQDWELFESARFEADSGQLRAPHLPQVSALQDDIEVLDARRFRLLGRPQNMLKVAGKRYSLDALIHQLQALAGVEDAVAVVPPGQDRPAALIVAPDQDMAGLRQALAQQIDAVFMPRPLLKVSAIPRNATGKVQLQAVQDLLKSSGQGLP